MIDVRWGQTRHDEKHVVIELELEGAEYLADVLREHGAHDGGAVAIADAIERLVKR